MVNTIVPVGVPHVGWVIELVVGIEGAEGAALIVTVEAAFVMQVMSVVLRTLNVFTPDESPANVAEA